VPRENGIGETCVEQLPLAFTIYALAPEWYSIIGSSH
jgi:hypothetical protein